MPVTTPDADVTVAILVLPLYQCPPEEISANVITPPTLTVVRPVGVAGNGLTTKVMVTWLAPKVYVMVHDPAAMPVTTPVVALTVATEVLLLVHVPPETESCNALVLPMHALGVPLMGNKADPVTVIVI